MGGGNRGRRQQAAEDTANQAASTERTNAAQLQTQLQDRSNMYNQGLNDTLSATRAGAADLRDTGGFKPGEIEPVREGYQNFATTGGFTPEQEDAFLRRGTAPVAAMYASAKDNLNRRLAVQGGYNPGFDASAARLTRQAANAGADASLNANVSLAEQKRQGQLSGLSGLTTVNSQVQQGRLAGQDALQRYSQFGANALSDTDVNSLRNRLQSGQMSMADSQLLATIAAQDKTLFDKIMQGVGVAAGAISGIGQAFN